MIRAVLVLLLVLLSGPAAASGSTVPDAYKLHSIKELIVQANPEYCKRDGCGMLIILQDPRHNAWYSNGKVIVSTALLERVHDQDELAFILSHEMAHHLFKHKGQSTFQEVAADSLALELMGRAGYNKWASVVILSRFRHKVGDLYVSHPNMLYRRTKLVSTLIAE